VTQRIRQIFRKCQTCLDFELGIPSSIKNFGYYELVPKSGFTPQVWETLVASVWRQVLAKVKA